MDNIDLGRAANSHDQYIGDKRELPDKKGETLMGKVSNCIKYDDISTEEGHYISMHNKYVYEVKYPDGKT